MDTTNKCKIPAARSQDYRQPDSSTTICDGATLFPNRTLHLILMRYDAIIAETCKEKSKEKKGMKMQLNFEKVIDLSYTVDENSPRELPIDPVKIYDTATIEQDGYFESRVDLSGHCATHIDVPCLMYAGGFTVAEIPQDKLTGNAVLMDLSATKQPEDIVTAQDIERWITENGDIPAGSIVFMRTGMDRLAYQESFNRQWIGFGEDAAKLLVSKGIKVIGTDACSIDAMAGHPPQHDGLPPAHLVFLGADVPQVEDLCNLSQLPTRFYAVIAPMKLARSSGAPTRVLAFV
ncbi:MAG: cyclase family protein [Candidatus Poribacteria bacterium]|nr:cyclase family protein [Candidatus Poribacteria bacterium]